VQGPHLHPKKTGLTPPTTKIAWHRSWMRLGTPRMWMRTTEKNRRKRSQQSRKRMKKKKRKADERLKLKEERTKMETRKKNKPKKKKKKPMRKRKETKRLNGGEVQARRPIPSLRRCLAERFPQARGPPLRPDPPGVRNRHGRLHFPLPSRHPRLQRVSPLRDTASRRSHRVSGESRPFHPFLDRTRPGVLIHPRRPRIVLGSLRRYSVSHSSTPRGEEEDP
jgi:hypothetical protein